MTYFLIYPLIKKSLFGGEVITAAIKIRRPVAKDLLGINFSSAPHDSMMHLMARVCGLDVDQIAELDLQDFNEISVHIGKFLSNQRGENGAG